MSDQSFVQVRVDNKLKQEALAVLDDIGMDMPNAIRMFLKRIVIERGLPFDAKLPEIPQSDSKAPSVVHIPAKDFRTIPAEEWIGLLCTVPAGKITRYCDIEDYFRKVYGEEHITLDQSPFPYHPDIPYWRIVSRYGMLQEVSFRCTKEQQQKRLEGEGLKIISCGAYNRSLKIESYKDHLYDFDYKDDNNIEEITEVHG